RLWDTASGTQLDVLRGHRGSVAAVAFSPDGRRLATAGHDGTARLWDAASGTQLDVLRGPGAFTSVAFAPDGGRLATGGSHPPAPARRASPGGPVWSYPRCPSPPPAPPSPPPARPDGPGCGTPPPASHSSSCGATR